MREEKLYCENCRFFGRLLQPYGCIKVKKIVDTPLRLENVYHNYSELNKNNDCKYYIKRRIVKELKVKKWYKFWTK